MNKRSSLAFNASHKFMKTFTYNPGLSQATIFEAKNQYFYRMFPMFQSDVDE